MKRNCGVIAGAILERVDVWPAKKEWPELRWGAMPPQEEAKEARGRRPELVVGRRHQRTT
jgi:hypothetical protein